MTYTATDYVGFVVDCDSQQLSSLQNYMDAQSAVIQQGRRLSGVGTWTVPCFVWWRFAGEFRTKLAELGIAEEMP